MEESILLHRLESRAPGHRGQAIDELIDIVRSNGKLLFSNKLSLFSAFKKILQDEDLVLRTKCSKLIQDLLPRLGQELDTCMSFVIANVLSNLGASNSSLKRESVKLIGTYAEMTQDSGVLIRPIIWEGIDNKDSAVSKEVILSLDKLIANFIKTDDCYNIIQSLCKRYYLEENKKMKRTIKTGFNNIVNIIGQQKMKETVSQLPTTLVTTGKELLAQCPQPAQGSNYTASRTKLEVDSAISVELLWDLVPEQTIVRLHGDDLEQQLLAIAELSEAIQMVAVPQDYLICIEEINESIIKVIPVNNFRVFKAALHLVHVFIETFREVLGDCVYPLTSVLCHKIGDNKIAVREGTMKVLTQMMETISPGPVLEVVIHSFKDRNARVREEAVNVVIKAMLTFDPRQLEFRVLIPNICQLLADTKPKVRLVALEALAVMHSMLGPTSYQMILGAADKLDTGHDRLADQVATRLANKGQLSALNEAGLIVHSEMCNAALSRAGSSMSNTSFSVPTTSHERQVQDRLCPPTPIALPRRYCSAGRNRLPWERSSRQNTLIKAAEEQYPGNAPRPYDRSNHVFIKGGGARTDGGSYAQMHLKKLQKEEEPSLQPSQNRSNTLGSLKKYFPSVKGSPDPKRSWPSVTTKGESEVLQHGPIKSNSFTSDSYSVQTASMFEGYRAGSGESSGVGTTNTTPSGSASLPPRTEPQLNDSGIFEEQSFNIPKKSGVRESSEAESRVRARKEILQEEELRREEERLEQARCEKLRSEEQVKEDKRRVYLEQQKEERRRERLEDVRQGQLRLEQQRLELLQQEEERRLEEQEKRSHHIGNGYVELPTQNIAKKKLKQASEEKKKQASEEKKKPKLAKTKTRTESLCRSEQDDTPDIDIVGKGLSSNHIELPKESTKELIAKPAQDKTPLRAPSGVYGQRVQPNISPEESLTEDEESDQEDQARNGYPVGSGLSAATRMRFEKKRAQYAERQSAEQHRNYSVTSERNYSVTSEDIHSSPRTNGKPVSAPVESRMPDIKRSPSKNNVRANSMRTAEVRAEHDLADPLNNSALCDEKLEVPLSNPEGAMLEAVKSIKCPSGQEEWNIKVQALHVFRRLARHHPDLFTTDLVNMIRLTCTEIQNLRSTVSRLAIMVLGDYFECLTSVMDADIERTCEVLLVKTAESNQFIRNDVQLALSKVVEHGTATRVLNALILGGGQHKNSFVRSTAATFIKECVQKIGINRVLAAKELTARYLVVLERLCHDGNQETRYNGKLMLSWCMEHPGFDGLCVKSLPAAGARNLKDMADKLQTKGLGSCPNTDRTSGRYRSQPVSRAQSNLSATYPGNRSRKPSQDSLAAEAVPSPRLTRRSGPRRDVRELANDRLPPTLFTKLGSNNWQERHAGIGELLELSVKQTADVRQSIVRVTDSFCPRLKDSNSKVNVYALQSLLKMLPHLSHSLDTVLTPFTEHLVPNLASQRANIVTITSQILDSLRTHVDNPALYVEYCRIVRTTGNVRIKPIIIDKLCDMVRDVHSLKPKLVEQITLPVITDNTEMLQGYVGRLCTLLHQVMGGNRLCNEVGRTKPGSVNAIREHLNSG